MDQNEEFQRQFAQMMQRQFAQSAQSGGADPRQQMAQFMQFQRTSANRYLEMLNRQTGDGSGLRHLHCLSMDWGMQLIKFQQEWMRVCLESQIEWVKAYLAFLENVLADSGSKNPFEPITPAPVAPSGPGAPNPGGESPG